MSNKRAKEKLIALYGAECFIEKLHLRTDTETRKYKSKGQLRRMKQLTYHHIKEKQKGGKSTVENGALLSAENHAWFNKQTKEAQRKMNEMFKQYKNSVKCKVKFVDNIETDFEVIATMVTAAELEKEHYNRAKEKRNWKKEVEEER